VDELKNWVSIAVIHPDDLADVIANTGRTEIDLMAELDDGTLLFGGCKWRTERVMRLNDLSVLQAKVTSLPEARWRNKPSYILFAVGGFSPELLQLAADPAERLYLVTDTDMLNR